MSISQLLQPEFLILIVLIIASTAWAYHKNVFEFILSKREFEMLGKLIFVVMAVLLMITIRNSIEIPAGQFIYGRF